MDFYIGVLFIVLAEVNLGLGASCGTLSFEQDSVAVGGSARLTYKANRVQASRKWYKAGPIEPIYNDSMHTDTKKYFETSQGTLFKLTIRDVEQADAGWYSVHCGRSVISNYASLKVTGSSSDATCGNLSFAQTSVTVGGTARLDYKPIRILASRKWYKEEKQRSNVIYDNTTSPDTTKYTETRQGDQFVLTITGVELKDIGSYILFCGKGWSSRAKLQVDTSASTTVPTTPSVPEFTDIKDIYNCKKCLPAQLNVTMDVTCFVEGGSEPIQLEMFKTGQRLSNTQRKNKNSLKRTILKYTFTPSVEDFDTVFKCTVKNPAMETESGSSTKLYIKVDPETVDIKVQLAKENETTEVQCTTTKGRPPIKSQIFYKTKQDINSKITNEIVTGHMYSVTTTLSRSFTRFDNKDDILCCSNILTKKCSNKIRVNVKFPPRKVKVTELEKINAENGDTVLTLECSVDESNPKSMVNWKGVKNLPKKVLDEKYEFHNKTSGWLFTTVLMFNLTKDDNNRNITCQVTNQEFTDLLIQHSYRPNITYSPVITIPEKESKTVYTGKNVFLTCHVDSNPPSVIVWYNETDKLEEAYGVKDLDLHLVNITLEHSQMYTCTATNNIGVIRRRDITLIVKDASEKTYKQPSSDSNASSVARPVIGAAVVIIVAVVAIAICLTVRKRKKNTALKRKESNEIKTDERKQNVHPAGNEPVYNNMAASNNENEVEDLPDYAAVVPKADRKRETEQLNPNSDRPEKGDNLVYAELDLTNPSENAVRRPLTEPTEYVSIDFTKTGTVQIDDEIHVVSD